MSDLFNEDYITFTTAASLTPDKPTPAAVYRWASVGIRIPDKSRIHLRHIRIGGRLFTTANWLVEFSAALAVANVVAPKPLPPRTRTVRRISAARRERQMADARRELEQYSQPKKSKPPASA